MNKPAANGGAHAFDPADGRPCLATFVDAVPATRTTIAGSGAARPPLRCPADASWRGSSRILLRTPTRKSLRHDQESETGSEKSSILSCCKELFAKLKPFAKSAAHSAGERMRRISSAISRGRERIKEFTGDERGNENQRRTSSRFSTSRPKATRLRAIGRHGRRQDFDLGQGNDPRGRENGFYRQRQQRQYRPAWRRRTAAESVTASRSV